MRILSFLLLAVAAGILLAVVWTTRQDTQSSAGIEPSVEAAQAKADMPATRASADGVDVDPVPVAEDADDCLSPEQLETHPLLYDELARLDPVMTSGPTIAGYRGLVEADLQQLASQGDSAAMTVLGSIYLLRARGEQDDRAVGYLLLEDRDLLAYIPAYPPPQTTVDHAEIARGWFYRAALHGRLDALRYVGEQHYLLGLSPVDAGWVGADDYAQMESMEKTSIQPQTVYSLLPYTIAPELEMGAVGEVLSGLAPRSEVQRRILDQLKARFDEDRRQAGLPPIVVPSSTLPSWESMRTMICDEYLEQPR